MKTLYSDCRWLFKHSSGKYLNKPGEMRQETVGVPTAVYCKGHTDCANTPCDPTSENLNYPFNVRHHTLHRAPASLLRANTPAACLWSRCNCQIKTKSLYFYHWLRPLWTQPHADRRSGEVGGEGKESESRQDKWLPLALITLVSP